MIFLRYMFIRTVRNSGLSLHLLQRPSTALAHIEFRGIMSRRSHQRTQGRKRTGEVRKHRSNFLASCFDEFRHRECACHSDAESNLHTRPAAQPCGVVGDVGVFAAELDDVVDYHDVGDTCTRAKSYQFPPFLDERKPQKLTEDR